MVSVIHILFICIVVPLLLILLLLDKKSRLTIGFMIIGIVMCLLASELNTVLLDFFSRGSYFTTTTITPISEEILKAIPVVFFGFVISDDKQKLLSVSLAVGIGFAVLENAYILMSNIDTVSLFWALARGFGSSLMHGICTAAVGYGTSMVHKRKKLFYTGTFGLLTAAIIYHAIFNSLVQSQYQIVGLLLPIFTYIPFVIGIIRKNMKAKKAE